MPAVVEFVFFFIVSALSMSWLASRLLGEKFTAAEGNLKRPMSAVILLAALVAAYLLAWERPLMLDDIECRPAGPGIHSGC